MSTATHDELYQHQWELEKLHAKNHLMPRLRAEFADHKGFDFKGALAAAGIPEEFGIDLLAQMALRKRADITTLVGLLRYHFKAEDNPTQACADMLAKCVEACVVQYAPKQHSASNEYEFVVRIDISDATQAELDCFQYPLPMVVPPKKLIRNDQSGYLTLEQSIILKGNHHDDDVYLEHINRMNRIPLCINVDVATTVHNTWKGLDKQKEDETAVEFARRKRAFEKYQRTCYTVFSTLLQHGNKFYLTHRYDKRGRIYSQGYHLNYQGNTWNKAVIEFANKEIVQ